MRMNVVQLPGPPIGCPFCGRAVRIAVVTATGRYCVCGAKLSLAAQNGEWL